MSIYLKDYLSDEYTEKSLYFIIVLLTLRLFILKVRFSIKARCRDNNMRNLCLAQFRSWRQFVAENYFQYRKRTCWYLFCEAVVWRTRARVDFKYQTLGTSSYFKLIRVTAAQSTSRSVKFVKLLHGLTKGT